MTLSLSKEDFLRYTSRQVNYLFPDGNDVDLTKHKNIADLTFDRLSFCFKHSLSPRYFADGKAIVNHLYSDHYLMYLWFLANTSWRETADTNLCAKLYYLNKSLHAFDCMYDTGLPDIFLVFHGAGTMLGKASYSNYFVALQGCTVGANKGKYPSFGKGVALAANSSVIGNCEVGERVSVSAHTAILDRNLPSDTTAFVHSDSGKLEVKPSSNCYAQQFFNMDLTK
jgi:serine O-acetyltransferase